MPIFAHPQGVYDPDISVIIPTHNRLLMLREALVSVFAQEFDGTIEIIVVDDCSEDKTSEIIPKEYPQICIIKLEQNSGAYIARNRALLEARGKFIAFLDSDDLWKPNYLTTQVNLLANKKRHFCVSAIERWDLLKADKKIIDLKPNLQKFISPIHELVVRGSFIHTPSSVVFPRAAFDELGLLDETFRVGGDREFYLRCLLAGYELIFNPEPLTILRKHTRGQLTDVTPEKIALRRQTRISYLQKHSESIEQKIKELPINQIYTEIHLTTAASLLDESYFLAWLLEYKYILKYAPLKIIFYNIVYEFYLFMKRRMKRSLSNNCISQFSVELN